MPFASLSTKMNKYHPKFHEFRKYKKAIGDCMQKSRGGFRDLKVWQKGKELAVYVYRAISEGLFSRDYSLRDQISELLCK